MFDFDNNKLEKKNLCIICLVKHIQVRLDTKRNVIIKNKKNQCYDIVILQFYHEYISEEY